MKKELYGEEKLLAEEKRLQWQKESARLKAYEDAHERKLIRLKKWALTVLVSALLIFALVSAVVLVQFSRYNRAEEYFTAGEYVRAADAFMKMPDYGDSRARVYDSAVELFRHQRYEEALPYFVWLDGYMDNGYYLRKCQELLSQTDE